MREDSTIFGTGVADLRATAPDGTEYSDSTCLMEKEELEEEEWYELQKED